MSLDKHSPIPLYYQLAELLREQIRTGQLKSGDQLPPERLLSERYAISRMTARQAIAYLLRDGTLITRHGLGTFVAEPKLTYDAFHLLSFTQEVMRRGGQAISRVLDQGVVAAPPRVARELGLASDSLCMRIMRLRLSDETPLLLETSYVAAALVPGLEREDFSAQSLYQVLEQRYQITLDHARQTLEATVANDYECDLFGLPVNTPMILLEGVAINEQERPIEYFKAVYRGDRFKFAFESKRSSATSDATMPRVSLVLA
jgi:GntR family transcriptional regulator